MFMLNLVMVELRCLLEIGNQTRPDIFALNIQRPSPLYQQVIEVDERVRPAQPEDDSSLLSIGNNGREYVVERCPDLEVLRPLLHQAHSDGCSSVAVVLAHGYAYPHHEEQIGKLAVSLGFDHCSLSHQVMPTVRMVPRGATTVINAYLTPVIQKYIDSFCAGFSDGLRDTELLFMASNGGLLERSVFNGSRALLSGPAGGVVGYSQTCSLAMPNHAIVGFDMGGTSTDVSRYADGYELSQNGVVAGIDIQAPQLQIHTVAAGGGSRLFFRHGMFEVGPESAGSHPGPVCYRKNGFLTVTDANLVLGRLQPELFPSIFGPHEDQPLDLTGTRSAFAELTEQINCWLQDNDRAMITLEEVAAGFIDVANEVMARPIRAVSVQRGYALDEHVLACFGGAGGQHACAMAQKLGIETIFIQRHAGILSAYGMGVASRVSEQQEAASEVFSSQRCDHFEQRFNALVTQACAELGCDNDARMDIECFLNLRYSGTDNAIMVQRPADDDYLREFGAIYRREFGFELDIPVVVDDVRVRVSCPPSRTPLSSIADTLIEISSDTMPELVTDCYLAGAWHRAPVYRLEALSAGMQIVGPALIIQQTATIVVETQCVARINVQGDVIIDVVGRNAADGDANGEGEDCIDFDPVQLALFSQRFISIAEQMGYTLQRTAISTNIKERCDFSCAVFDAEGNLVANAPHTPVHLGAMSEAVRHQIELFGDDLFEGDVLVANHPQHGGSHLPDITVITPLFSPCGDENAEEGCVGKRPVLFVANRGHHADIGGITPGSMPPFSRTLSEEGCAITGLKLVSGGQFQQQLMEQVFGGSRRLVDNISDLKAQVAANQCGVRLLTEMIIDKGLERVQVYMTFLQDHAERAVRQSLQKLARRLTQQGGDGVVCGPLC